jgi:putative ubiquitin-RnfH superfamily antitoxin RatB of RatAB toxin-antitoxin module
MASIKKRGRIVIEVAYARPDEQVIVQVALVDNATAKLAIEASGLLARYPEIDLNINKVGVFGKLVELEQPLRNKDRVEIYRPLQADPKESRRRRAAAAATMKQSTKRV